MRDHKMKQKGEGETAVSGKTALVLAGGGVTGIAYELGALHAIDCSLTQMDVNQFDVYVGTSAGATVAALLANGFTPGAILRAIEGKHRKTRPFLRKDLWRLDTDRFLQAGMRIPGQLLRAAQRYLGDLRDNSLFGSLWVLLDLMPAAIYDSHALEQYLRDLLAAMGGSNDFNDLAKELDIIATRLDTGQRTVFNGASDVPISEAITASSAVPGLFKPVRINGIDYMDGGVRGNASIDVAVERGATTVICINPIVPYDESPSLPADTPAADAQGNETAEPTMQSVLMQVLRTRIHAGLHYHIKHMQKSYPAVDFYLIEPDRDDAIMSAPNLMRYRGRLQVAQRAFESVTWQLAQNQAEWDAIWQRRGVRSWPALNQWQRDLVEDAADKTAVLHRLLKANWPPTVGARRGDSDSINQLHQLLDQIDEQLDQQIEATSAA